MLSVFSGWFNEPLVGLFLCKTSDSLYDILFVLLFEYQSYVYIQCLFNMEV